MNTNTRIRVACHNDLLLSTRLMLCCGENKSPLSVKAFASLQVYFSRTTLRNGQLLPYTVSETDDSIITFRIESTTIDRPALYNIYIVGVLDGNDVCTSYEQCIEVVPFSSQSNLDNYICTEPQTLSDALFIIMPEDGATLVDIQKAAQNAQATADEANQRSKDNTTRLDSVQETANAAYSGVTALGFASGAMADADLYAWYASGVKMKSAKWNIMGDYCFLSLFDVPTIDGWFKVYYSLPFTCVVPTHGLAKSAANQELYWSIVDEPTTQVKTLCIAAMDDTALVGTVVSFSLCYKFK